MVLLELNSGEAQKSGYRSVDDMFRAVERLLGYPGLALRGLMTVAPWTDDAGAVRSAFQRLAKAQTTLKQAFPELDVSVLSMGMSGDYTIAIEEGSTLVRIGTAIFGERH